ncbi:hypothetical protein [uncultured Agitococcus sp.]|uniref:hypothetical protein n=1 Tax=uncultured Agitococcus sp. TaxID=1506599 RepID=UPI0026174464|nr:hypothetical protein [uncultured Agitococcus sp.]
MKLSVKITIVRAVMYMTDNFFVNLKSVSNFIFKHFGLIFSEQKTSVLLANFGLSIKDIKTLPQREWLQPIYDDILLQVGDL